MTFSVVQAAEASGPLTRGFLLVEPTTLTHAPGLSALNMRPCGPPVLAHREELMPRLIDVAVLDNGERMRATESWMAELHAERPPVVCAWLDSEATAEVVSDHLGRALIGPGVDGRPVFWRYYDPRVLALTLAVVDAEQRRALFGPIRTWRFAWAGHRWSVASDGSQPSLDDRPPGWPRPEQWAHINRSEAADRVLRRLPALSAEQAARLPAMLDQTFSELASNGDGLDIDASVALASQRLRRELTQPSDIQGTKR
jgi:hypothetical protein